MGSCSALQRVRQFMTQNGWSDNQYRGVSLARTYKRLEKRLKRYDKTDNPDDDERVMKLAYHMQLMAIAISNISRTQDHEKRIAELEKVYSHVHATGISA